LDSLGGYASQAGLPDYPQLSRALRT
jgi:hypothetical protein